MRSNDKASVTKEQSDRHRKILEGLMKLPDNRDCADCRSRGPRWASVNLGVFVCIHCSGIHRSLGVHISKVRSATLDTWLLEQVTFMQGMGNSKANAFWEAELPRSHQRPSKNDRNELEAFIRAKYEARRWVPRTGKSPLRPRYQKPIHSEDQRSTHNGTECKIQDDNNEQEQHVASLEFRDRRDSQRGDIGHEKREVSANHSYNDQRISKNDKHPELIIPVNLQHIVPLPASKYLPKVKIPPASGSQKVEVATDLFEIMSIENPLRAGACIFPSSSVDDRSWATFESTEPIHIMDAPAMKFIKQKNSVNESAGSGQKPESSLNNSKKNDIMAELEDLFKGLTPVALKPEDLPQSSKDPKKEILNLFDKSSMPSPNAVNQHHMTSLSAQHQSMLLGATSSGTRGPSVRHLTQQHDYARGNNGSNINMAFSQVSTMAGLQCSGEHGGATVQNEGLLRQVAGLSEQYGVATTALQVPNGPSSIFHKGTACVSGPHRPSVSSGNGSAFSTFTQGSSTSKANVSVWF